MLALQDVTSVRPLQEHNAMSPRGAQHAGFEVCAPPLKLKLRVEGSDEEQQTWIDGLERRVEHWRLKAAAEGPARASPNLDADADHEVEGHWRSVVSRARGQDAAVRPAW